MALRQLVISTSSRVPTQGLGRGVVCSHPQRSLLPVLSASYQQRDVSSLTKRGSGGRSSFSGIVATVFGATGFIGRYVVNRLGKMGSQIIVPYRGNEHDYRHLRLMGDLGQVIFLEYDLRDPESVRKVLQHSNVAINLVGRDYETRNFKFGDVHVEGARTIAQACRECDVERLIHFSALNADHNSPSEFLRSKALGEEAVLDAFPSATIFRPSDIYGYEDRFINYYANMRMMPFGMIPMLKQGAETVKRPVFVGDVASAVMRMIEEPDPSVTTYELAGPKGFPLPDLVVFLYQVMYRQCRIVTIPPFFFKTAAFFLEMSPFIPYMTRDILTRLHLSNVPTANVPGLEDLGITPTQLEDKAISFLRTYRESADLHRPIEDTHPSHARK